jgi:thioesterase domain-containing protein
MVDYVLRYVRAIAVSPRDLQEALEAAKIHYKGAPYDGKVLFLESDEGRLFQPTAFESWRELINDVEVLRYPGEHGDILKEPYLGLAAEEIQNAIDRALDLVTQPSL